VFTVPTLRELIDLLVADFANRLPTKNVSKRSDNWKRLANFALGITTLHRHQQVVARDMMPDTAGADMLPRHGALYGVTRKPATSASRSAALRITGTAGSAYTIGDQLTTVDGLVFQVNATSTLSPGSGTSDVDVLAVSTGAATRKSAGTIMTFVSPPSGIDATAVLQLDMNVDGADIEDIGAYRVRILDRIAQPGMGGNANDYRQWAKEVTGIDEAFVWPLRGGLGSVHLAALRTGTGASRLLGPTEIDDLKAYIDARRPVGYADFAVLTVDLESPDVGPTVELAVEPEEDAAYQFDWDDEVVPTVLSYTSATRILRLNAARPADMVVGTRIVYVRPGASSGRQIKIEALSSTDSIVLEATEAVAGGDLDPDVNLAWPSAGNLVYAGGPLVDTVRAAVVAHMDKFGPGRADTASPTEDFSAAGSSYWEGTLRPAKLQNLSQKQKGVLDTEVVVPTANVSPTNEAPTTTVGLLYPKQVIVRKKW